MYILGLSCFYHDASACLIKDGKVVAGALEERFSRKKHDFSFPINAAKFCLAEQGISVQDIAYVGFYEKPILKFERVLFQHLESFPKSFKTFAISTPSWVNEKLRVLKIIKKKLKYQGGVFFVEHHLAHAASAFLVSPFEEAAILTADGVGELTLTSDYNTGVNIGSSGLSRSLYRVPFCDSVFTKPKSDASPIHQRCVIFFPVT